MAGGEILLLKPVGTERIIMMEYSCYINRIKASLAPSTGCTEPAAIALNAATARVNVQGEITRIVTRLDA